MRELSHLFPLELKLAGGAETGMVAGYASTFGTVDLYGDVIRRGAFLASLSAHKAAGRAPAMLWQHDMAEPIGRWLELEEDDHGLKVGGRLNLATTRGREAFDLVKAGDLDGLSIGFVVPKGGAEVDRKTGLRVLSAIDLWEVSLVTIPANPKARTTGAKAASAREFERFLHASGYSNREAKALAAGGWPALATNSDDNQLAAGLLAEIRRTTNILKD